MGGLPENPGTIFFEHKSMDTFSFIAERYLLLHKQLEVLLNDCWGSHKGCLGAVVEKHFSKLNNTLYFFELQDVREVSKMLFFRDNIVPFFFPAWEMPNLTQVIKSQMQWLSLTQFST